MFGIQNVFLFLLRISIGWLIFYAGITKVLDPEWSAAGFLNNATTFPEFFQFFATPTMLPLTDFLNEWGLTLIGIALVVGVFTRISAVLGAMLMVLYYFPTLNFPYPTEHTFIVDDHLIYALLLLYIASASLTGIWGLGRWATSRSRFLSRSPRLQKWVQ